MDDWESFIDTCENEEYAVCAVVVDGEAYRNVGIRAKGNTSLSAVPSTGSDRYSFKIEFDQYDSTPGPASQAGGGIGVLAVSIVVLLLGLVVAYI